MNRIDDLSIGESVRQGFLDESLASEKRWWIVRCDDREQASLRNVDTSVHNPTAMTI